MVFQGAKHTGFVINPFLNRFTARTWERVPEFEFTNNDTPTAESDTGPATLMGKYYLFCLISDGHVVVNDTDAALERH